MRLVDVSMSNFTSQMFQIPFSNSLIIHQLKTKKITTVKKVWPWIPVVNKHSF